MKKEIVFFFQFTQMVLRTHKWSVLLFADLSIFIYKRGKFIKPHTFQ